MGAAHERSPPLCAQLRNKAGAIYRAVVPGYAAALWRAISAL